MLAELIPDPYKPEDFAYGKAKARNSDEVLGDGRRKAADRQEDAVGSHPAVRCVSQKNGHRRLCHPGGYHGHQRDDKSPVFHWTKHQSDCQADQCRRPSLSGGHGGNP